MRNSIWRDRRHRGIALDHGDLHLDCVTHGVDRRTKTRRERLLVASLAPAPSFRERRTCGSSVDGLGLPLLTKGAILSRHRQRVACLDSLQYALLPAASAPDRSGLTSFGGFKSDPSGLNLRRTRATWADLGGYRSRRLPTREMGRDHPRVEARLAQAVMRRGGSGSGVAGTGAEIGRRCSQPNARARPVDRTVGAPHLSTPAGSRRHNRAGSPLKAQAWSMQSTGSRRRRHRPRGLSGREPETLAERRTRIERRRQWSRAAASCRRVLPKES